jgi:hypothetical protein
LINILPQWCFLYIDIYEVLVWEHLTLSLSLNHLHGFNSFILLKVVIQDLSDFSLELLVVTVEPLRFTVFTISIRLLWKKSLRVFSSPECSAERNLKPYVLHYHVIRLIEELKVTLVVIWLELNHDCRWVKALNILRKSLIIKTRYCLNFELLVVEIYFQRAVHTSQNNFANAVS